MRLFLYSLLLFYPLLLGAQTNKSTTVFGYVYDMERMPIQSAAVSVEGTDIKVATDSLGRFEIKDQTLPIQINVSYLGYISKSVKVKRNEAFPIELLLDEEVMLDFFDERPSLSSIPASQLYSWGDINRGDIKDIAVGRVYFPDSTPAQGACISQYKNPYNSIQVACDSTGLFYYPIKKFPTKLLVRFIGCKSKVIKITSKNVKKLQTIHLEEETQILY